MSHSASDRLYAPPKSSTLLWTRENKPTSAVELFGFDIDDTTVEDAASSLVKAARDRVETTVAFLNAHSINKAFDEPRYARVLSSATVRYADGSGIALAAKLFGCPLASNVNGTDLLPVLAAKVAQDGLSLYCLGGREGVAAAAATALKEHYPTLRIVGTGHGYFEPGSREESRAIADINVSRADILLVGLGLPQQDLWLARNRRSLLPPVRLGVGGLFDFFSGRIPRAPKMLRNHGLEWIWRLYQEPRRMWRRYLLGNVSFVLRTFRHLLARRLPRGSTSPLWFNGSRHRERLDALSQHLSAKRLLDIVISALGLAALSPLLGIVALAIRIDTPGPVLYRQERVGLTGRPFLMSKFRSMIVGADRLHQSMQGSVVSAHDIRFKAKQDARVTRVGRFIRRWSLDELPQLWNVLIGDMSLVGPRPALPCEVAHYGYEDRDRLLAVPGITGSWQVNGRADIDFVGQVALDRDYVRRASLRLDAEILLRTLPAILAGRGAY